MRETILNKRLHNLLQFLRGELLGIERPYNLQSCIPANSARLVNVLL